jgi:hypothetical protein
VAKLGLFGGRPIGGAVEALLTKVDNQQSSVLPIVLFFIATTVGMTQQNGYSQRDVLRV